MKVLLVTQYFYPENFKSNDIAFGLSEKGYHVDVLTGIPNYPEGKFYKGYSFFRKRIQNINGIKIFRAFLFPRGKANGWRLAINYFSYAFTATLWVFVIRIFRRYDAIIVHEPSPITQGIPAVILKKISKTPVYFWVLDLWPESLISAGGIKNKKIIAFFTSVTRWVYKNSDKILISSKGFEGSILEKGDYFEKLIYFPNWGEDVFNELPESVIPDMPGGFKILYAGNIGEAQDFDAIMDAAERLKDNKDIKFIIVGGGRKRRWVEEFIIKNDLSDTVFLFDKMPLEAMPVLFMSADVMLVSLKNETIFNLTVPAKVQAYMAASKPIIGMLNGEGARIINEAQCGVSVNAGDSVSLANEILRFSMLERNELNEMGSNAHNYYLSNFDKENCINKLCNILNNEE